MRGMQHIALFHVFSNVKGAAEGQGGFFGCRRAVVDFTQRLPGPFSASLEMGYRYLFTDYIDDVSGGYVPYWAFSDPLARIMSDRSAEPTAYWAGEDRNVTVIGGLMSDGNRYYTAGGEYGILMGGSQMINILS